VDPNSNFVLEGSSINVGDRVIGRVALINDKILDFEFYSQATHSDLELLIQSLRYNLGANARGIHKVELQLQDGVGGTVEKISTLVVDPLNAPPSTILLTPNTAKERISGLTIGRLSAVDPDVGQTHQFVTSDARVTIVGGELRLKSDAFFDRSQGATVSISVTATDSGDPAMLLTQDVLVTLVANTSPWRNSARNVDVNRSMSVTPLDALLIINELNRPTISRPGFKLPTVRPFDSTLPYFDTSGDGLCSPLDALLVINALNLGDGEGEGGRVVGSVSTEVSDAHHGFVPSQLLSIGFAFALEINDRVAHTSRSMWTGKLLFTNANESASLAKSLQRSTIDEVPIDPDTEFCTSILDDLFASMGLDLWSLIHFEHEG
jgi:Dockerin type I domain